MSIFPLLSLISRTLTDPQSGLHDVCFQNLMKIEFHTSKSHLTPLGSLHFSKKFHTAPEDDGVVSLRLCFIRSAGAHVEAAMPLTTAIPSLIVVKSIPFC